MRKPNSIDVRPRLKAPATLSRPEAAIWRSIVVSVASDHFAPSDAVLLAEFCRAAHLANVAAAGITEHGAIVDGKPSAWLTVQEKAHRALTALSARLRLCPQSRFDRLKAGVSARTGLPDGDWSDEDRDLLGDGLPVRPKKGLASFRRGPPFE